MRRHGIKLLKDWPAQSPDLNIIENLQEILKKKTYERHPSTFNELKQFAEEEFFKIIDDYIANLYKSIKKRCQLVIEKKGIQLNISY